MREGGGEDGGDGGDDGGRWVKVEARRANSSEGSVQRQFADRNTHSLTTKISKAKNALAVGDDDHLDAPLRPVLEHLKDLPLVLEADVQALWPPVDAAVLLAGLPDRRRVHHRQQLLHVVDQELVEQPLTPLLKKAQKNQET